MKVSVRAIKNSFKSLQKGRLRWFVAVVASIEQSIRYFSPVLIYVDRDGDWYNCRRHFTLVAPELNVTPRQSAVRAVTDYWNWNHGVRTGNTVVDIGAGIGDDVVIFSELVGVEGCVVAIEANPRTFRCLMKTVKANQLVNVVGVNAAIADTNGYTNMSDELNHLSNNIVSGRGDVSVRVLTLESALAEVNIESVDFVKMNIEGAEVAALRGMTELLKKIPRIVVSCHDFKANRGEGECFRTFDDVKQILEKYFGVLRRADDPRPEVSFYLYGSNSSVKRSAPTSVLS
ncbi:FkbM family methyltransferase [uncultured Thiodictyon sp.]|uniref:FkbM family methyltransferase n=1 Tax=uncultured Thiodictyon sp. TaxID=1846217 RepID=UPI0025E16B9E|nr:FkbM family methyltransferase [uncultured Thiodictyon sp.]